MAVNCILPLGLKEAEDGESVTELTVDGPLPWRRTTKGWCCASVMSERLPSMLLAVVAANFIVKLALCPGDSVTGSGRPTMLKPTPLTVAWLMPILLVPTFVTVATREPVLPIAVLIERLLGETKSGETES